MYGGMKPKIVDMTLEDERTTAVKVDSYGRVTIPKGMRKYIGLQRDLDLNIADLVKIVFQSSDERASAFLEPDDYGRVTIPEGIREHFGLEEGDVVKIEVEYPAELED